MDYKNSGVDVEAGRAFVEKIKASVESTHGPEVIGGLGGFGGFMRLPSGLHNPVLVGGTDGVGTKLELAQQYQGHFGVGIDLVAMCINDVITSSAKPLFFLDYIATGTLTPASMQGVIAGISHACRECECALLGGETAEMPGFYSVGTYDLAGFCVGVVEESKLIDGKKISSDDQILAIASTGVHSNGFSLVRKVIEANGVHKASIFGSNKQLIIDKLLCPTALYAPLIHSLLEENITINGMAHITGGGLPENLPRCLPKGLAPVIDRSTWEWPEIFNWLKDAGNIPESDMWNTFNLGVGYCLVLPSKEINAALNICNAMGFDSWALGTLQEIGPSEKVNIIGLPY